MAFEQNPMAAGFNNQLKDENLFGNVDFGMGRGGKMARNALKQFQSGGDIGQNDFFKYKLNAMKAIKGQDDAERNRKIAGNLAFAGQPGLVADQSAQAQNEADYNFQTGVAQEAGNAFNDALNEYFRSRQEKNNVGLQAAGIRGRQLADAANANNNSWQQKQQGFWSRLANTAVGAALGG